jgi:ubiquinol-cytochrome c reductase cytochrome b subunit
MAGIKERAAREGMKVYRWLEHRLGLIKPVVDAASHPTPANNASWMYVFGSAATVLLILQVVTGICWRWSIALPPTKPGVQLNLLNHNIPLGWYLRALHGWGSDFMIAIVLIHMVQVFLFGAYKFPTGADLDCRRPAAAVDTGHGLHRPGDAF